MRRGSRPGERGFAIVFRKLFAVFRVEAPLASGGAAVTVDQDVETFALLLVEPLHEGFAVFVEVGFKVPVLGKKRGAGQNLEVDLPLFAKGIECLHESAVRIAGHPESGFSLKVIRHPFPKRAGGGLRELEVPDPKSLCDQVVPEAPHGDKGVEQSLAVVAALACDSEVLDHQNLGVP